MGKTRGWENDKNRMILILSSCDSNITTFRMYPPIIATKGENATVLIKTLQQFKDFAQIQAIIINLVAKIVPGVDDTVIMSMVFLYIWR